MTQLLMTQSAEASGNGSRSIVARWNSTLAATRPLIDCAFSDFFCADRRQGTTRNADSILLSATISSIT